MNSRPGYSDAWNAWRTLKQSLPADDPGRRVLDLYFAQALDIRPVHKAQVPAPVHKAQVPAPEFRCPDPTVWGGDQYKCPRCGRIWDFNDERPNCQQE